MTADINYQNVFDKKEENERQILAVCPDCPRTSGIYFILREENGFKYAYIGQAKNLLQRLASHLSGFQYIDVSIKKHGLYSDKNPTGYKVHFLRVPETNLDDMEQYFIRKYANAGYQLRNLTSGSQSKGKRGFDNARPSRGYYDGKMEGEKHLARELKHIIDTHLVISLKKDTKISQKALEKFKKLLEVDQNGR
jgi:hypothetical protein